MVDYTYGIKEGDIVLGRSKCYWRVTKVERQYWTAAEFARSPYLAKRGYKVGGEKQSLVHMEYVMNKHCLAPRRSSRTDSTNASWLQKVTPELVAVWKETDVAKWDRLAAVISPEDNPDNPVLEHLDPPEPEFLRALGPPESLFKKEE
jgi:hypothetical protein